MQDGMFGGCASGTKFDVLCTYGPEARNPEIHIRVEECQNVWEICYILQLASSMHTL